MEFDVNVLRAIVATLVLSPTGVFLVQLWRRYVLPRMGPIWNRLTMLVVAVLLSLAAVAVHASPSSVQEFVTILLAQWVVLVGLIQLTYRMLKDQVETRIPEPGHRPLLR